MKKIVFIFCMIGCSVALWGQNLPGFGGNSCGVELVETQLMSHGSGKPFSEFQGNVINLENSYFIDSKSDSEHNLLLKIAFTKEIRTGDQNRRVRLVIATPRGFEPWKNDTHGFNYPEGYNVTNWRQAAENNPNGGNGHNPFPRFYSQTEYYRREFQIAIDKNGLSENQSADYSSGGNPMAIMFKLNTNTYNKNATFNVTLKIDNKKNIRCPDGQQNTISYFIDLIRPNLVAPADQTIDLNSSVDIPIDAKDKEYLPNGPDIPQSLKSNAPQTPKDVRREHIETGVFTEVTEIEKFENGAWTRMNGTALPRGLYINQETQKIEGTAEEEGIFKIYLKTTDVAGNENSGGFGTPLNYRVPDISFILTIQQQAQIYANPGMRMRVAQ